MSESPFADTDHATDNHAVSGLSAAHTVYLAGGNVVLLDKNSEFEAPNFLNEIADGLQTSWVATLPRLPPVSMVL